jgi:hypothetical protein
MLLFYLTYQYFSLHFNFFNSYSLDYEQNTAKRADFSILMVLYKNKVCPRCVLFRLL